MITEQNSAFPKKDMNAAIVVVMRSLLRSKSNEHLQEQTGKISELGATPPHWWKEQDLLDFDFFLFKRILSWD